MASYGLDKSREHLISYCGLYCGSCEKYKKGNCPGCRDKSNLVSFCSIKKCNTKNNFYSCADCKIHESAENCKKMDTFFFRLTEKLRKINRKKGIKVILERGYAGFASYMSRTGFLSVTMNIKR